VKFITNPPWTRELLHPMIEYLVQSSSYSSWTYCRKIVSVGRVKWIPDSKHRQG
jgi:hypothetical protein